MTDVKLTADHIADGERRHCSKCPVALAVSDAFQGKPVTVSEPPVIIAVGAKVGKLDPRSQWDVDAAVEVWDAGGSPWPFTFRMAIEE